jgi:hypothetical protein
MRTNRGAGGSKRGKQTAADRKNADRDQEKGDLPNLAATEQPCGDEGMINRARRMRSRLLVATANLSLPRLQALALLGAQPGGETGTTDLRLGGLLAFSAGVHLLGQKIELVEHCLSGALWSCEAQPCLDLLLGFQLADGGAYRALPDPYRLGLPPFWPGSDRG